MKQVLFIGSLALIFLSGCAVEGCTDPNANNFNPDATLTDGSCTYTGEAVFWYGQEVAETKGEFATAYSFYVDGELVGSQAVSTYWTGAPDCGQNGSVTVTKDLGNVTSYAAVYEVIDDAGYTVWSGIVNFQANTCYAIELTL